MFHPLPLPLLMIPAPGAATPPSADPAEPPDLVQLLAERGLGHWHAPLVELCQRHQGWLADYEQDAEMEPDYRPLGEVLMAVGALPCSPAGDDQGLARAIGRADFMARAALDRYLGEIHWDPLHEPYRTFAGRWPSPHPYWSSTPDQVELRLMQWAQGFAPSSSPGAQTF